MNNLLKIEYIAIFCESYVLYRLVQETMHFGLVQKNNTPNHIVEGDALHRPKKTNRCGHLSLQNSGTWNKTSTFFNTWNVENTLEWLLPPQWCDSPLRRFLQSPIINTLLNQNLAKKGAFSFL